MKLCVYSLFDRGTDQFGNPHFLINDGQAIRSFSDEVNRPDKDNMLHNHAEHFDLYKLGFFDTETGQFSLSAGPEKIAMAAQLKTRE